MLSRTPHREMYVNLEYDRTDEFSQIGTAHYLTDFRASTGYKTHRRCGAHVCQALL